MDYNTNVNVRAAYKTFPFLADYFPIERVNSVVIREVDEHTPFQKNVCSGGSNYAYRYSSLFLLDDKGNELGRSPLIVEHKWLWFFTRTESVYETPQQMISRIDCGELVTQVLYLHESLDGLDLVLYRAPKTYSFISWIEELERRRVEAVENECRSMERLIEVIDSKGDNPKLLGS